MNEEDKKRQHSYDEYIILMSESKRLLKTIITLLIGLIALVLIFEVTTLACKL